MNPKDRHTSKTPLDYAHSDLWGPSQLPTMGEASTSCQSSITTQESCGSTYKEKSEAYKSFKEWYCMVEIEKNTTLKCLMTDSGLEFLSLEFERFYKVKGVKRHKTAPRNLQLNGVAERMNKIILERVRCMFLSWYAQKVLGRGCYNNI